MSNVELAKTLLLVNGDTTHVIQIAETKEVETLKFFEGIQLPNQKLITPLLPNYCRQYVKRSNISTQYILELPPDIWLVTHQYYPEIVFKIAVPFTLFGITTRSNNTVDFVRILFSKTTVTSPNTEIYCACLPNQHGDGTTCPGREFHNIINGKTELLSRINSVIPYFKNSSFNEDINPSSSCIPTEIDEVSRTDPFISDTYKALCTSSSGAALRLLAKMHIWTLLQGSDEEAKRNIVKLSWRSMGAFSDVFRSQ